MSNELSSSHSSPEQKALIKTEQYTDLKADINTGNYDRALQTFVSLQSNDYRNPAFQAFAAEVAENLDPHKETDLSKFFASLPFVLQSNIIDFAKEHFQGNGDYIKIFNILFQYIKSYPLHAYKYLIEAINTLILSAQKMEGEEKQQLIKTLVTELFPRLCDYKLLLVRRDIVPSVRNTNEPLICLPYNLFEQFLLLGQRFYIKQHKWKEATQFTCSMLAACGYKGLDDENYISHHDLRLQYLKEHRNTVRVDREELGVDALSVDDFVVLVTVMCEYMAASCQFVQFGYDYYRAVCGMNSENTDDKKSCLIPICIFQPNNNNKPGTSNDKTTIDFSEDTQMTARRKRPRLDYAEDNEEEKIEQERNQGLDSYCVKGVDDTLHILSQAGDCLRHIVELWQWASDRISENELVDHFGNWEKELCRVIESYKLPFDMHNAVLLVRSDLALSSPSVPGNLAKALELSQNICDRIDAQRREEKTHGESVDADIPLMFTFRVLYNIGIIYLLVGSLQQSTLEIAIILSVFPIPDELEEKDFLMDEIDCCTVANIFHGREFGLMRVTQEGLVVRCIKHLVVGLDNESEQKGGMASIDSALRWDEKAGNMIVMMQYGWPYWYKRTNLWQKIISKISEKRIFKNREFLEYLYVSDVLNAILQLHLTAKVTMDIIPPEFALRGSYKHLVTSENSSRNTANTNDTPSDQSNEAQNEEDHEIATRRHLPLYQPTFANTILPSTSMSPSWYSASTQKNSFAQWMSPSFYYSRPATSVILPDAEERGPNDDGQTAETKGTYVPREMVTRCLEYRIRKYPPKITPQRMRHVLQRFLKNMVLKANEES
ncbi:hypothetical protein CU097_013312 [Rhizopus azygosporus]|uniref:Uncharacterized protein n=2 Tax=Rhizopus TaxID=4842 RepID=A0A367K9Z6_RHIAZ|nr:hypothetical protein G6F69_003863 [Rhizopus microsporus]KAG1230466.1 hypothetical protein G6F67_006442 [Rhizopus microsporus]KAG1262698.1 hypothetical protein G6F68_005726 [Rhizopus microsporus]ORE17766.1 hypothetical protein BCV71DRAFT_227361 [Rhizopus microsporus]RCH98949.1 hypothetical protein CU097_013312 [Rhizopus azygosporus]